MIVAIHQPNFLPWLGYFNKLLRSDVFVLFDDVTFPRAKTVMNRVLIKTRQGPTWVTVPVTNRGDQPLIRDVRIAGDPAWRRKILRTIEVNYAGAPYTKQLLPAVREIVESASDELWRLNQSLIVWSAEQLGARTELVLSSALCADAPYLPTGEKIQHLLKATGATTYLSGETAGSKRYIDEAWFEREGIELVWQQFRHPRYPQLHGDFAEFLSILDLLFNCGPQARSIVLSG